MVKTQAIRLKNPEPMMVTWDTGKRCNYNCTYCEATRHDNYSQFHSVEEYLETFEFIKQWSKKYNLHRNNPSDHTNLNFTGGEPTLNPNFWILVDEIKKDNSDFRLSLTTNGAWNKKYTEKILKRFSGITVSYHAESNETLKQLVIDNILDLHRSDIWLQVNVMLHAEFFDECVSVYNMLKDKGVAVKPRPIGDGNEARKGWFFDTDGELRKTTHDYNKEQTEWFFQETGVKKNTECASGDEFGRGCCGGRCLEGLVEDKWVPVDFVDTKFKDWYCSVDWYFLHVEQHTGLIYHHQTCQAKLGGKKGPIGNLNEYAKLLSDLDYRLENQDYIACPNQRCGCGMCAPKAKNIDVFNKLKASI